jgi:hypothetical protein
MTSSPRPQTPLLISLALVGAGVLIAALGGITAGSILGGAVAALGVVPAAWAAWAGMQKETQGGLAMAILMVFVALGVGGLLILLRLVDWLR